MRVKPTQGSEPVSMAFGLRRFLVDIRDHRERFRQFLGIAFIILVSVAGNPEQVPYLAGAALVIIGSAIRLWASGHVKKNKVLATTGPYAFVRHPLYVGNLALLFGFAFASGLWWAILLLIGFLLAFYPPAIRYEDAKLQRKFGEKWEQWHKKTRALIPRLTPYQPGQRGNWSFKQSLRQNGEPIIALFLLFCLYILYPS
jgi:protein-S-isoprenylcysteine O-methyltransferase Ste14